MAQNIWDDAFKNTLLKPGRLDGYLAKDPASINSWGGIEKLTPLAGACYNGHLEVVELLLKNNADPKAPCPNSRTALFYAVKQCARNQLAIIEALLAKGADPNEKYPEDDDDNPLALAIDESQDKEIVQALVKAGAIPTQENVKQAKKRGMERDLKPKNRAAESLVDLAVSAVTIILAYTDSGLVNAVTKGMVKKMYKITDPKDNPVRADIPEPKTPDDFMHNISNFVKNAGLDKFFKKNPKFLQTLAQNASKLRNDPDTDLGKPDNIKRLTRLSVYQLVIYCDDSGSMLGYNKGNNFGETRYESQCKLVSRMTKIATKLVPDGVGIELRFINHPSAHHVTAAEVDDAMTALVPHLNNLTKLGTNLVKKILDPLVYEKISDPSREFERPILVCVITDGVPNYEEVELVKAIADCKKFLVAHKFEATSVMFCVSQIGDDEKAKEFLKGLNPEDQKEIRDVLYPTTEQLDSKFAEMKENMRLLDVWLLEMLTMPIMQRHGP